MPFKSVGILNDSSINKYIPLGELKMSYAGCDFVCRNKECAHVNKSITMFSSWPIGDIDVIIASEKVREDSKLQDQIISRKQNGEQYALITLPNKEKIMKVGNRIQKWCPKCPSIWNYDIVSKEDKSDEKCKQCQEKLLTFDEVIENGVFCPHCKEKMKQVRWCANE
jgi:hypothetical protein